MKIFPPFLPLFFFSVLFYPAIHAQSNPIDALQTQEEVIVFLKNNISQTRNWEKSFEVNEDRPPFGKSCFFTLDLDGNGLTDLLVNNESLFAVTAFPKDQYEVHSVDHGLFSIQRYTLVDILETQPLPLLLTQAYGPNAETEPQTDTLVFKFGGLLEYNPHPYELGIQEFTFTSSMCFGTCPAMELSLNRNGEVKWHAIGYNHLKGNFSLQLSPEQKEEIWDILNYIQWNEVKDDYAVSWTDAQTVNLSLTYQNGEIQKVRDYGLRGTRGLRTLYLYLLDWVKTQDWQPE